jgi:SAM-dependent methyltransferase
MIDYLSRLLPRHGPVTAGQTALDLACGTGTVALALAQQGLKVYAVDGSPGMIEQARRRVAEVGADVTLSCQDMRSFTLPEPVDLVTCFYDSLNYLLTPADLIQTFRQVRAALCPGGLFMVDANTPVALTHIWGCDTYFGESPNVSIAMQNTYDPVQSMATLTITGFVRHGDLYERFQEEHVQRGYNPPEIATALTTAGLRVLAQYECFSFDAPSPTSQRVLYVAQRPHHTQETRRR